MLPQLESPHLFILFVKENLKAKKFIIKKKKKKAQTHVTMNATGAHRKHNN